MKTTAYSAAAMLAAFSLALLIDAPQLSAQQATTQGATQPTATMSQPDDGITFGQMMHNLNPMNWRMPQMRAPNFRSLLPQQQEKARIVEKKNGFFAEVSKTAANSWQRTKAALSPQNLNPVRFMPASAKTPSSEPAQPAKPGFFRSLFSPSPEPSPQPSTVTDFLRQERIQ